MNPSQAGVCWLLTVIVLVPCSRVATAQKATSDLVGDWEHSDGSIGGILFRFEPGERAAMWIGKARAPAAPTASGTWKVLSESKGDLKNRVLKIDLIWMSNSNFVHKINVTFHGENKFEMAFNDEEIRFYNRVRSPTKQREP